MKSKAQEQLLGFINRTWRHSTLPSAWKNAMINNQSCTKKGKENGETKNYWPISLTSSIGKLAKEGELIAFTGGWRRMESWTTHKRDSEEVAELKTNFSDNVRISLIFKKKKFFSSTSNRHMSGLDGRVYLWRCRTLESTEKCLIEYRAFINDKL